MSETVVGIFSTHQQAEDAVREIERSGFDMTKLSIIGRGYHTEENAVGFYTAGDRIKVWGGTGAFWGALWGLLFGAAFFWVPGFGPLLVAGPLVHALAAALGTGVVAGGLSALGAALVSLGLPRDSVIKYETALKADKFLVIAHGTQRELELAREVLNRQATEDFEAAA